MTIDNDAVNKDAFGVSHVLKTPIHLPGVFNTRIRWLRNMTQSRYLTFAGVLRTKHELSPNRAFLAFLTPLPKDNKKSLKNKRFVLPLLSWAETEVTYRENTKSPSPIRRLNTDQQFPN